MINNINLIYKNTRTIKLKVSLNNEIILTVPRLTSKAEIDKIINTQKNYIDKRIAENDILIKNYKEIFNFTHILFLGEKIYAEEKITQEYLKKQFDKNFKADFINKLNNLSNTVNLHYKNVSFKFYKTKWGSCDSRGYLKFNILLFMLPKDLIEYIILHELCHLKFLNHKQCFWNELKKYNIFYKENKNKLKKYTFLTKLYL